MYISISSAHTHTHTHIYTYTHCSAFRMEDSCMCSVLQCVAACCSVLQCAAAPVCSRLTPPPSHVCCNTLQCASVWCSVLQCVVPCVAVRFSALQSVVARLHRDTLQCNTLQHIATHCNTQARLQREKLPVHVSCKYVAVCCSVLQCVAVRCSALHCVAVPCRALQCVAVCCSALQCATVLSVCYGSPATRTAVSACLVHMCCSVLQCVVVCCSALLHVAPHLQRQ